VVTEAALSRTGLAVALSLGLTVSASPAETVILRCERLIDGRAEQAATGVDVQVVGGPDRCHRQGARRTAQRAHDRPLERDVRNARVRLQNGFTTLRDPGDEDLYYSTIEIRDAIARGDFEGPRLFVAPHMISSTGGHGDFNDLAADLAIQVPNVVVDGPDAMRKAVREEIKHGADWIKLAATGGVMSAADDPRAQAFTDEEFRAAVDEAHRHGRKVTVHAIGAGGLKAALRAGVDCIEHGVLIDDEAIAMMKERNVPLVPTIYVLDYIIEQGETANREFARMVRLGLSPMGAIKAATANAARVLGIESVSFVMNDGRVVRPAAEEPR
jgi:imidazolonepropionase-like amidohydrolase